MMEQLYRAEVRACLQLAGAAESLANCQFMTDETQAHARQLAQEYRAKAAKWLRRLAMLPGMR